MQMHNPAHPGEVLRELYLDGLGLSITEAAKGLGLRKTFFPSILRIRQQHQSTNDMRNAFSRIGGIDDDRSGGLRWT